MKIRINKTAKKILIATVATLTIIALIVPVQIKISEKYIKSGNENLGKHYYKSALLDYEKASAINPYDESLKIQMGDLYLIFGDGKKAKEQYKKAVKKNPNNTQAWNKYIKTLLTERELYELADQIARMPQKVKEQKEVVIQYSRALANTGDLKKALNVILKEDSEKSLFYQSVYNFSLGNYEKGVDSFELISKEFQKEQDYKILKRAIESGQKSKSKTYQKTIIAQALNEVDEPFLAEKMLKDVVEENSDYRDGYLFLGYSYYLQKDNKKAKESIEKTIEIDPFYGLAHFFLAECYFSEDNKSAGKESIENAIKFGYKNAKSYFKLAELEQESENFIKASEYFRTAIDYDKNNEEALEGLIESLLKQGKINESRKMLDGIENNYLAGLIELEETNFSEAEKFFKKALQKTPYSAKITYQLCLLYKKTENYSKKEKYIKKTSEYDITGNWEKLAKNL